MKRTNLVFDPNGSTVDQQGYPEINVGHVEDLNELAHQDVYLLSAGDVQRLINARTKKTNVKDAVISRIESIMLIGSRYLDLMNSPNYDRFPDDTEVLFTNEVKQELRIWELIDTLEAEPLDTEVDDKVPVSNEDFDLAS